VYIRAHDTLPVGTTYWKGGGKCRLGMQDDVEEKGTTNEIFYMLFNSISKC